MKSEITTKQTAAETINAVDAQLIAAGIPTYSEVVALLNESKRLGLSFFVGNAYIRRAYIDKQTELCARIKQVNNALENLKNTI